VSADLIKQLQALLRRWPAEYYPTQPPYPPDFAEALDAQARRIGELERDARAARDYLTSEHLRGEEPRSSCNVCQLIGRLDVAARG
jgi:hypothetical protein